MISREIEYGRRVSITVQDQKEHDLFRHAAKPRVFANALGLISAHLPSQYRLLCDRIDEDMANDPQYPHETIVMPHQARRVGRNLLDIVDAVSHEIDYGLGAELRRSVAPVIDYAVRR